MTRRSKRGTIQNLDVVLRDLDKGRQACFAVNAQAKIHSPEDLAADTARKGIDGLAEVLTGEKSPFSNKSHST